MSDHYTTFVPTDPRLVPSEPAIAAAVALAQKLFPEADSVTPQTHQGVVLFDAGENFESVFCGNCGKKQSMDWWHEALVHDEGAAGFTLAPIKMLCCGTTQTLNQLKYEWTQAFGRFGLEVMNANVGQLKQDQIAVLATALQTSVIVVYQAI